MHKLLFKTLASVAPENNKQIEEVLQGVFLSLDQEYLDLAEAARKQYIYIYIITMKDKWVCEDLKKR